MELAPSMHPARSIRKRYFAWYV